LFFSATHFICCRLICCRPALACPLRFLEQADIAFCLAITHGVIVIERVIERFSCKALSNAGRFALRSAKSQQ
jgi:hypothetical protein